MLPLVRSTVQLVLMVHMQVSLLLLLVLHVLMVPSLTLLRLNALCVLMVLT